MKKFYLFAVLAGSLALPSCKIMYAPNAQNVPLMQEKGEIRANIGVSNYQAAYAVTENIGVMANGQFKKTDWSIGSDLDKESFISKKWLGEVGAGYFKKLGEHGVMEAYTGLGYGSVTFDRTSTNTDTMGTSTNLLSTYNANTFKLFVQPAIGVSSEYADYAFSMRFVGLKFNNIDTTGYTPQDLIEEDIADIEDPFFAFLEPAVTVRVGWKYVKFHTQLIYSLKLSEAQLNYNPFNINVGVNISIADRHKS